MTDEEIIKYLEQAVDEYDKNEIFISDVRLDKLSLDLINRQQAEIERLKIENQSLRGAANSYKIHYDEAGAEAVKEFAEQLKETITNAIDTYYSSNGGGYYLAEDTIEDIDSLLKKWRVIRNDNLQRL